MFCISLFNSLSFICPKRKNDAKVSIFGKRKNGAKEIDFRCFFYFSDLQYFKAMSIELERKKLRKSKRKT